MSLFSFSKVYLTIFLFSIFFEGVSAQQLKEQRVTPKNSQTIPSKSDSAKFLTEKIGMLFVQKDISGDHHEMWKVKSDFSNENCQINQITSKYYDDKLVKEELTEIDLSKINPTKIQLFNFTKSDYIRFFYGYKNPSYIVQVSTLKEAKDVNWKLSNFKNGELIDETKISKNFAWIFTPDEDSAGRVERALKHLVTLCGGKDELF